jgi:membrane protease YdiL (CAAX protease family)
MRNLATRRPLVLFLLLTALLSWWPWPLYALGALPLPVASFGPFLAAVAVLWLRQGRAGVGSLLRSMVRWQVPARAYLFAIGTPLLVTGAAVGINVASGAHLTDSLGLAVGIPVALLVALLLPGFGGAWEEPGWRGFALGRLETRFGRVVAPLLLGAVVVVWHLPLFAAGQILTTDVLSIVAFSVVIAAVFHLGRESVLVAMLMHATNNAVVGGFASQLFAGVDETRLGWLTAGGWCAVATAVLVVQHVRREPTRQQQPRPFGAADHQAEHTAQSSSTRSA